MRSEKFSLCISCCLTMLFFLSITSSGIWAFDLEQDFLQAEKLESEASAFSEAGDHASAIQAMKQALAIYEQVLGKENTGFVLKLNRLGSFYYQAQKYGIADSLIRHSLALQKAELGMRHVNIATVLIYLGQVQKGLQQFEAAETLFNQALEIREALLGPKHPDVAGVETTAMTIGYNVFKFLKTNRH